MTRACHIGEHLLAVPKDLTIDAAQQSARPTSRPHGRMGGRPRNGTTQAPRAEHGGGAARGCPGGVLLTTSFDGGPGAAPVPDVPVIIFPDGLNDGVPDGLDRRVLN